ncbi:hypothetical protein [Actinomadura darangshiensis]|uniref:hypothetical protein n=1 Tax=Actinomadura darangshiensis TaxID=705336 RepID=UPI00104CAB78|nr:hypothetical protein [Actinomadura darangshiensis]
MAPARSPRARQAWASRSWARACPAGRRASRNASPAVLVAGAELDGGEAGEQPRPPRCGRWLVQGAPEQPNRGGSVAASRRRLRRALRRHHGGRVRQRLGVQQVPGHRFRWFSVKTTLPA